MHINRTATAATSSTGLQSLSLPLPLGTFVASSVSPSPFSFIFFVVVVVFVFTLLPRPKRPGNQAYLLSDSSNWATDQPTNRPTNNFSGHDTKIDSMSSLFGSLIDMSNQAAEMCPQNAASSDTDNETSEPNNAAFRLPL